MQLDGKAGYSYDFRWNYQAEGTLVSYDTSDGIHRIDYLPLNPTKNDLASNRKKGYYVLVETKTPSGYQKAAPKPVIVEETAEIQLYGLENRAKSVYISKLGRSGEISEEAIYLAGAELAVFRAAQDGSLVQEKEYLVERWISGSDGKFTEEEAEKTGDSGRLEGQGTGSRIGFLRLPMELIIWWNFRHRQVIASWNLRNLLWRLLRRR